MTTKLRNAGVLMAILILTCMTAVAPSHAADGAACARSSKGGSCTVGGGGGEAQDPSEEMKTGKRNGKPIPPPTADDWANFRNITYFGRGHEKYDGGMRMLRQFR
ncbi:hypothetical protein ACQBAR_16085 [Propionibacteriaceae bacterium Y1685]